MRRDRWWGWGFALLGVGCTEVTPSGPPRDAAAEATTDAPTYDAPATDLPATPADVPVPADYADALAQIRLAACQRVERCNIDYFPSTVSTVNLCVASTLRFAVEPDPPRRAMLLAGFARGDLVYDPSALAPCLDAIARSCGDLIVGDPAASACRAIVHGRVVAGAACRADEECASGLRCRSSPEDAGPDSGCAGTCGPSAVGEPCRGSVCGALQCTFTNRCVNAPLVAPVEGGSCSTTGGGVMVGYRTCPTGQVCTRTIEDQSRCFPLACDPPCGPNAVCDYTTHRCLDAELLGAGAACGVGHPCDPRLGLWCDASSHCAPRGAEGHECGGDGCAPGLLCYDSTCQGPRGTVADGRDCYVDGDCASGACVDQKCLARGCFL